MNFFNNKLRDLYRKEEDVLYLREKLIESAFDKIIEDDILKFHVIYFIKNLKLNQTKKKYFKINKEEEEEEDNDDDDEDEEEEIIKEKEKMKNNFFILFEINSDETNEKNENNYEFRILKEFNKNKEIVEHKNTNNENDINTNEIVNDQINNNHTSKNGIIYENENENDISLDKRNILTNNIENVNESEDNNDEEENRISENSDLERSKGTFEKNKLNLGLDLFDLEIREEQEPKKLNY